jgi:tyrosine-protein kinase Etk/Wzc
MNDSATNAAQLPEAEDEISLLDLLQVVADNLRLLILGPLAVGLAALGISFAIPPTFTAKTLFLPPQQQQSSASALIQSLGSMGGLAGAAIGGIKNPADQYIAFMKTASLQDALIERFKLQERYEQKFRVDTRKQLLDNTKLASGKDGIITLEVDDRDPKFAADLANAYIDELRRLMTRLAVTEAQMRRQFFEGKLKEAKESLTVADQALRSTGINSSTLKSSPAAAVEVVAKLRAGITAQEIKIANMRGFLTESAPDIKQAMNELSVLREQLARAEKDDPQSRGDDNYIARFRAYKYSETLYELFAKQYELARVDEAREGAVIQVVDPATPPEKKAKPKKALIAVIATLAAGFLLLLWVFVRQALRSAAQNPDSAAKIQGLRVATRRALGLR